MSAEQQETPLPHKPGLDGIRGIAVLLIVLFHSWPQTFAGGFIGVDIFFVLSGYLITQILLRDYGDNRWVFLSQFYKRRALRLLPALWLVALVMLPIGLLIQHKTHQTWIGFFAAVFYTMDWARAFEIPIAPFMGHTWSLAIEEQFYLIWPGLFLLMMTMPSGRRIGIWITLVLFLVAGLWRAWLACGPASTIRLYTGLDTHADGLLMGCLLALAAPRLTQVSWRRGLSLCVWPILAALTVFVALVHYDWRPLVIGGYEVAALMTAILVFVAAEMPQGLFARALGCRPLCYTGRISYGLYLWHWPILCVMRVQGGLLEGWITAISAALAFTLSALSYHFLERPILNTRYRHARHTVSWFGAVMGGLAACEITIGSLYILESSE